MSTDLRVAGVGDFNGDGKSDVLWRGSDGHLETWVGAADGSILSPTEKLWQDAIANYELFHEIGHAVDYFSNFAEYTSETSANTTGKSIETAIGLPLMNVNGTPKDPNFGYNP